MRLILVLSLLTSSHAAVTPSRTRTLSPTRTASPTRTRTATKSPTPSRSASRSPTMTRSSSRSPSPPPTPTPSPLAQAARSFIEPGTWQGGLFIAVVGFAGSVVVAGAVALLTVVRSWQRARGLGGVVRDVQSVSTTLLPRFIAARRAEVFAREFTPDEPDADVAEPLPPRTPGFNVSIYEDEPAQISEEDEKTSRPRSAPAGSGAEEELQRRTWRSLFFGHPSRAENNNNDGAASSSDSAEGVPARGSLAERAAAPAPHRNVAAPAPAAVVPRPAGPPISAPSSSSRRVLESDARRDGRPRSTAAASARPPRAAQVEQAEDPGTAPRAKSARTRRSNFLEREKK